jgi:hypothetical protein
MRRDRVESRRGRAATAAAGSGTSTATACCCCCAACCARRCLNIRVRVLPGQRVRGAAGGRLLLRLKVGGGHFDVRHQMPLILWPRILRLILIPATGRQAQEGWQSEIQA